jgi:rhodanese-related sulfurtransferase
MTRHSAFGAGLALCLVVLAGCGSGTTAVVDEIAPDAAATLLEAPATVLLDIRTPDEFAAGHIAGAANVDFYAADFNAQLDSLDSGATYVIYCRSGNRTTAALEIFRDLGFTEVHAIAGGIVAWEAAGGALVAP